ncbi:carboxypeptidase regulatory-like domain-containing protein [[Eubacterium] cellulosolvens]
MSSRRRSSLAVLLLIVVGSIAVSQPVEYASAHPDDAVETSPGAYAGSLGTPADMVKLEYPKSSIILNATGDFSLTLTLDDETSSVAIFIPSEFDFLEPDTTSIWTSLTNDYSQVSIRKLSSRDPMGPLWWKVMIANLTISAGTYVVRLFNIRAPDVCGRYFMKVFIDEESIGSENFPTVVVKASLDPSYVSGRVLNGGHADYGVPVNGSGRVVAEGKTASGRTLKGQAYFNASEGGAYILYGLAAGTYNLTASASGFVPTTMNGAASVLAGQSLEGVDIYVYPSATITGTIFSKCASGLVPWGYNSSGREPRPITIEILDLNLNPIAVLANRTNYDPSSAYHPFSFNGSTGLDGLVPQDYAEYVSGLEPGDYYLEAHANGYFQRDVVAVHVYEYTRSVSVPFDLWRTGWFEVTVFFTDYEGGPPSPVPKSGRLTVEAYSLDGTLWGSNSSSVPEGSTNWATMITGLPSGTYIIQAGFSGYVQTALPRATVGEGCSASTLSLQMAKGGVLEVVLRSVDWQTPPREMPWSCPDATIRLEVIGSVGEVYVGTAEQEADVAITIANVTGVPADTYLVRVYTIGYIQTRDYFASVSLGSVSGIMVDLVETTRIETTLTFRTAGRIAPIDTYPYDPEQVPVRIELYDSMGVLAGANVTYVPGESDSTVEVIGFQSYAGNPCSRWANYYDTTDGRLQKDYGLPAGEYLVRVWVPGYLQSETLTVSTSLHVSLVGIAVSLERLAHVSGFVQGLNMYQDLVPLSWATVTAYGPTLEATCSMDGFYEMWLMNGTYVLAASSAGYETQATEIHVSSGWETPVGFELGSV